MKQGKSLDELARELMRQNNSKKDYIANTAAMQVGTKDGMTVLRVGDTGMFPVRALAHRQIRERIRTAYGIRQGDFYDQIRSKTSAVFDDMVNRMFAMISEKRMVRTLDYSDGHGQTARAFLSDRYRRLDNFDVAKAVLPVLSEKYYGGANALRVESSEVTESRLYLKFVYPGIERTIAKVGDVVQAGVVISNSEVGEGALAVSPMVYTLACSNGMIVPTYGTRRNHVGGRLEGDEAYEIYSDETLQADDTAFFLKVRDSVRAALTDKVFNTIIDRLNTAIERPIEGRLSEAVKVLGNRYQLTDAAQDGILGHLARGGDPTAYTLLNAVTRYSQDVSDYDEATRLERVGAAILDMPVAEWADIAT